MIKNPLLWLRCSLSIATAATLSSCVYDDSRYYGPANARYSGPLDSYPYGSVRTSTSIFISTGNPRWGYDPHCHSYYDYSRRCYYNPHLRGYYPVGYRPPVVHGASHPHGWRPGMNTCPPPRQVRNHQLAHDSFRGHSYRNNGYHPQPYNRSSNNTDGRHHDYTTRDATPRHINTRPQFERHTTSYDRPNPNSSHQREHAGPNRSHDRRGQPRNENPSPRSNPDRPEPPPAQNRPEHPTHDSHPRHNPVQPVPTTPPAQAGDQNIATRGRGRR